MSIYGLFSCLENTCLGCVLNVLLLLKGFSIWGLQIVGYQSPNPELETRTHSNLLGIEKKEYFIFHFFFKPIVHNKISNI